MQMDDIKIWMMMGEDGVEIKKFEEVLCYL